VVVIAPQGSPSGIDFVGITPSSKVYALGGAKYSIKMKTALREVKERVKPCCSAQHVVVGGSALAETSLPHRRLKSR
jgi:hypothetical protein